MNLEEQTLRIGVVGYSGQKFDVGLATDMLRQAYAQLDEQYAGRPKTVVSGLTDVGVPALAYRQAQERGWKTVGIACAKAEKYQCFAVDERIIVGAQWGEESPTFLNSIDVLVRVGGGNQSMVETADMKARNEPIIEYELPALKS